MFTKNAFEIVLKDAHYPMPKPHEWDLVPACEANEVRPRSQAQLRRGLSEGEQGGFVHTMCVREGCGSHRMTLLVIGTQGSFSDFDATVDAPTAKGQLRERGL